MAKIKLAAKTDLNINQLTKTQIGSIIWDKFPMEEQLQFIDADVYRKLNGMGRAHVNQELTNYLSKDVEFWNAVFEHKDADLVARLIKAASAETIQTIKDNHLEQIRDSVTNFHVMVDLGIFDISAFMKEHGKSFSYHLCGYIEFAHPLIPVEEWAKPFTTKKGKEYSSVLEYVAKILKSEWEGDEYPILVPNKMLKDAGLHPVHDLTVKWLVECSACEDGKRHARTMIKALGTDNALTWDTAVEHIRSKPDLYNDSELMERLTWWYCNSYDWSECNL